MSDEHNENNGQEMCPPEAGTGMAADSGVNSGTGTPDAAESAGNADSTDKTESPGKTGKGFPLKIIFLAAGAVLLAAAVIFCLSMLKTSASGSWLTSYDEARDEARRTGKDVFFCFTGSDWNQESADVFAALSRKDFTAQLDDRFVFCNINIMRDSSRMDAETLETNYRLAGKYAVEDFPFFVLLTAEGDVYGAGVFRFSGNGDILEEATGFISTFDGNRETLVSLKNAVKEAEGVERARRIHAFLSAVYPSQYNEYEEMIRAVPSLDAGNESGLKGSYLLQSAWFDAAALLQAGKAEEAVGCFTGTLDDPAMTPALKQQALYLAAGMYAAGNQASAERIISLLEQAVAMDPQNMGVAQINQIIEGIRQQAAANAGGTAADAAE